MPGRAFALPPEATTRGCRLPLPRAALCSKNYAPGMACPRIAWYGLRLALGDDETVVCCLEAMLACGPIFRTLVPGLGLFVARKLEDNDFFSCGPFQNFMTPMNGAKNSGVLMKTGRS